MKSVKPRPTESSEIAKIIRDCIADSSCSAYIARELEEALRLLRQTRKIVTYDQRCLDLAIHFLEGRSGTAGDTDDLAKTIQRAIEDWLAENPHVKEKK